MTFGTEVVVATKCEPRILFASMDFGTATEQAVETEPGIQPPHTQIV